MSCLARGADQLFAALVLGLGGRLKVILPARDYRARKVGAGNAAEFDRRPPSMPLSGRDKPPDDFYPNGPSVGLVTHGTVTSAMPLPGARFEQPGRQT